MNSQQILIYTCIQVALDRQVEHLQTINYKDFFFGIKRFLKNDGVL